MTDDEFIVKAEFVLGNFWPRLIALARIGAAVKPRPISEAPKDGTDVLLWCGWWITGKWAKRSGNKGLPTWVTEDAANSVFMVTHYSHLPPPPPEQQEPK